MRIKMRWRSPKIHFRVGMANIRFTVMKRTLITFVAMLFCGISMGYGQLDSLFTLYVDRFDTTGFCYYHPGTLEPGDAFSLYQFYTGDTLNQLVLKKAFVDTDLGHHHYRYQQTYKGLRVEFAEFVEHADDGFVGSANGKLVADLEADATPTASEMEARAMALSVYDDTTVFAWQDTAWENELKQDLEDDEATYYPDGELLWALDNYSYMPYLIPASRYRLAWRFDMVGLKPDFHTAVYVDASTGEVFRQEPLSSHNGPASVFVFGGQFYASTQTIDTKWSIGSLKYILRTDDSGREIHTKKFSSQSFGATPEVKDGDDNWDVADIIETSVHWFVSQSWDFFSDPPFSRDGMDDGKLVRVYSQYTFQEGDNAEFWVNNQGKKPRLHFSTAYGQAIDIVGHEFTHGVTYYTAELPNSFEGGALNESFSDFFGTLVERRANSGVMDWSYGNNPASLTTLRRLDHPELAYTHFDNACTLQPGQATTYQGVRWESGICGDGGAHGNCGVQNLFFYLLAMGGAGTNDNNDSYSVQGIGIDKAARIAYRALTTHLLSSSQYPQSRQAMITAAEEIYGVCSAEAIQTTNAWYAVGVGNPSSCPVGTSNPVLGQVIPAIVYPNPSMGSFKLLFPDEKNRTLIISSTLGDELERRVVRHSMGCELDLRAYPAGMYVLTVTQPNGTYALKLVKQ